MKRLIIILWLSIFTYLAFPQSSEIHLDISPDFIRTNIEILAHDSLEGRGTGQPGGNKSAAYIASYFREIGLIPLGDRQTFFQYIPMHGSIPQPSSELDIFCEDSLFRLELDKDYLLYKTGQQTFIPAPIPLVFAGFGIHAPEFDYNDYHSIDVEGKIVVFLEGEPESDDPKYFMGQIPTTYSLPESKQRLAFAKGAAGSILLPREFYKHETEWRNLQLEFAFENVVLAYTISSNFSMVINPKSAEILFNNSPFSLDNVYEMNRSGKMRSFDLGSSLSFKGIFRQRDFLSPNVIGLIEGSDEKLSDSYIVVSAHYDHLGIGPEFNGDSIYNGALDNAIGTAVLMEIARSISQSSLKPKRSMIFLATTGEEKGLLGSAYYVENPAKPLYKTIANVNIDGIALFRDFKSIVGVGAEHSTLSTFLDECAKRMDLNISQIPEQFYNFEAFSKSDQIMFATSGIPSILILEGIDNLHVSADEVIKKMIDYDIYHYHTPFDDLKYLDIDFEAARQHSVVLKEFISILANSDKEPEWNQGSLFINARLRSKAEKK